MSTEAERFWAKVDRSGGPDACWPWRGFIRPSGYGMTIVGRSTMQASRYAWIETYGSIGRTLHVDHQCHNRDKLCPGGDSCPHRRCCNPAHLEAVTPLVNKRRAMEGRARPLRVPHHGTASEYRNHHCRCDPCRQAQRAAIADFRALAEDKMVRA